MSSTQESPKPSQVRLRTGQVKRLPQPLVTVKELPRAKSPAASPQDETSGLLSHPYLSAYPYVPYVDLHMRGNGDPEWTENDVNNVVRAYLGTCEPQVLPPVERPGAVECDCCSDMNKQNRLKRLQTEAESAPNDSLPWLPSQDMHGVGYDIYRSESPDLTSLKTENPEDPDNVSLNQSIAEPLGIPLGDKKAPGTGSKFLTHNSKYELYNYAGLREKARKKEADKQTADAIVKASSNYTTSMDKLDQMIKNL